MIVPRRKQTLFALNFKACDDPGCEGILDPDAPGSTESVAGGNHIPACIDNIVVDAIFIQIIAKQFERVALSNPAKIDLQMRIAAYGDVLLYV